MMHCYNYEQEERICGLLSALKTGISRDRFDHALATLHHRGPDASGVHHDPERDIFLGHTRLSIIDLVTGTQPLYSEDRSLVLTCNGELYDFERIRQELEERGHRFQTKSDSEIIIHLYREYGEGMFEHLRGEFAFVLVDYDKEKVIVGRDRFGIKPLFVARTSGDPNSGYVFSSEVKAIFKTSLIRAEIDPIKVRNSLSYFASHVIFKNITIVPPASYMMIDMKDWSSTVRPYWHLDLPNYGDLNSELNFEELKQQLREKFDEAVKLRLRADVPVGVFLSGGVDSSAVIGAVSEFKKDKVKAFSISFSDGEKEFDESTLARKMAEHVGAEYHEIKATKQALLDNFEKMLWHTEIPTHNLHGVGKFLLSQLARQHVTVCLTGEGGDEAFLGYEYFKLDQDGIPQSFSNISGKILKARPEKKQGFLQKYQKAKAFLGIHPMTEVVANSSGMSADVIRSVFHADHRGVLAEENILQSIKKSIHPSEVEGRDEVSHLQYYSIRHVMAPYILNMLGDRQEMSHSLEGRTPLLDHHLFEFARTIPLRYKIKDGDEKHIFKEMTRDRVTPEIYNRHKWPFFAPSIVVSKGDNPTMDRFIETYLSKEALDRAGLFDTKKVRRILNWYFPLSRWVPKIHARLNNLLMFILSVQILHAHFCEPEVPTGT